METVRASVICIFAAGLLGSLAMILIPGRKNNMIMKAVVGIFIVMSMIEPIKNAFAGIEDFSGIEQNVQAFMPELPQTASQLIKDEISEIISAEAKEHGIEILSVEAEISEEENCIIIHKITVIANENDSEKLKEFERSVSRTAGVEITAETK